MSYYQQILLAVYINVHVDYTVIAKVKGHLVIFLHLPNSGPRSSDFKPIYAESVALL